MKQIPRNPVPLAPTKRLLRSIAIPVCLGLGALLVFCVAGLLLFPDRFLNGAFKQRIQRAFEAAHPAYSLRLGGLHYSFWKNYLVCDSLTLAKASGSSCQIAGISVQGLDRARLLFGKHLVFQALAHARVSATNLDLSFPASGYGVHCGRLEVALPDSEIVAEAIQVRPLVNDEQFFAMRAFRRTRFDLVIPQCRVLGLASVDLLQNNGYYARSIQIQDASLDAFLNRDKPANPQPHGPFTVQEALAIIPRPLVIEHLDILNGQITFRERVAAGTKPGVLTFDELRLSAEGICNRSGGKTSVILNGRTRMMHASTLELFLEIPTASAERSFRYSGSFSAMDLAQLNPFLEVTAHTRIKSGMLQEAVFNVEVTAGHATGQLRALYQNVQFVFLDRQTGNQTGIANEVKSFLADHFVLHTSNPPANSDSIRLGLIDYTWKPQERVLHFLWFALRSGIFNVLGLDEFVKNR